MADVDVVVVGGGLAGLIAARDVAATGRRVTVLEARDRLGGRTWTTTLPGTDVEVELGGTWVHPDAQPAVAAEIARYGLPMRSYPEPSYDVFVTGGRRLVGHDGDSPWTSAMRLLDGDVARIATRLGGPDERAAKAGDGRPRRLRRSRGWTACRRRSSGGTRCWRSPRRWAAAGRPSSGSCRWSSTRSTTATSLDAGWADIGVSFIGGTRRAGRGDPAGSRRPAVERGRAHRAGRRRRHGAARGRRQVAASAAVVALPLNVWRDVAFDPPLTGGKAAAREAGHPGRSSKVLAIARNVPDGFAARRLGHAAQRARVDGRRRWRAAARGLRRCSSLDTCRPCRGHRRGAGVHRPMPRSWRTAATTGMRTGSRAASGSPSRPAGSGTIGGEDLEAPVGRLAFAGGDIPRTGAGWIEGAVASGGRARHCGSAELLA